MDQCLTALGRETQRLTHRIERLLDWGRMEAGRKQYELRPESVTVVVDDAVKALEPIRYRHPDVQFSAEIDPEVTTVEVDRAAMLDALINLLSNAVKYGGTPPVVTLRVRAMPGNAVAFEVSDNGQGIPRVEHRRIFEKFYRIDDRLSRQREGSGLGLAIVKHVVRAHRGRVQLDSAKGEGSTFRLIIPKTQPKKSREAHEPHAASDSVPAPEAKRA
jgi:two-component system phosphate regulon sensor histidine kinase PhoR